ncbi:serine carboxypeptidase-like 20-like [Trifolium medium]|uniref:Serine carboxypeptidase-like 20-like n=1 Tax=Trifolium medium TaxID=97028 RepID=A0A392M377_9FABA|nr:serine carboxypeptidase-like 20-like [Trifolium medium]
MKGIDAGVMPKLNFKGYIVGNGVTDEQIDGNALVPFVHGMGLISNELFEEVSRECNGNFYNPLNDNCTNKLSKIDEDIDCLNVYNILEPCYHGTETDKTITSYIRLPSSFRELGESETEKPHPVRNKMFARAWPLRAPVRDGNVPTLPQITNSNNVPCTDGSIANAWLNNDAVRKAIHTVEKSVVVSSWDLCPDKISFRKHDKVPQEPNLQRISSSYIQVNDKRLLMDRLEIRFSNLTLTATCR